VSASGQISVPDAGNCGDFTSVITWSLKDDDGNYTKSDAGGVIIHNVSVSFNVTMCDPQNTPYHFGPPQLNKTDPSWWPFYEAWTIPPYSGRPTQQFENGPYRGGNDKLQMGNFGPGTQGSITITASAGYYYGQPLPFNFAPGYAVPAGSLPSASWNPLDPAITPTSSVSRTVTASWNCCCHIEKTTLTAN
jgi:hypothetical protein